MRSSLFASTWALRARCLAATLLAFSISPSLLRAAPPSGYTQVWSDEFDGTALDTTKWSYLGGTYWDAVRNQSSVSVANGKLTITTYTDSGTHYTGFLSTRGKYQPLYGYIEASIQSDVSSGVNHAFWTQAPTNGSMIGDPENAGIEMDIVEHRHTRKNASTGIFEVVKDKATSAIHWDGYGANHEEAGSPFRGTSLDSGYHLYAVEWTPSELKFYIDGAHQWTVPAGSPVPQRSEFIYLTAAVHDSDFMGPIPSGGYGTLPNSTTKMHVDYVRVYQASPAAPAVPGWVVAASGNASATLRWTLSANAETHNIKRALTPGGPYTTIATGVKGETYADSSLTNGATYYYVVSAASAAGESANSAEVSAAPQASHTTVIVDNPAATQSGGTWSIGSAGSGYEGSNYLHDNNPALPRTTMSVQWTPSSLPTTNHEVFLKWTASSNRAIRVPVEITHAGGTATVYVDQTQNGSAWYQLGTYAFNGSTGSVKISNDIGDARGYVVADAVRFVQLPLPPPAGLTATAVSATQVNLAWSASAGAASYTVKRSATSGGPYTDIATGVTATSYMDTGRAPNTTYFYVVAAVNSSVGSSTNSLEASELTAPAIPTGLAAYAGDTRVVLNWSASPGATSYNVKRAWSPSGTFTTIGTPNVPTYTNTGLTNGAQTFYYMVSAVNGSAESGNTAQVSALPTSLTHDADNATAGILFLTGSWTTGTATPGYLGTNYIHDGNTGTTGGKKARFKPAIAAGYYEVWVRWPAASNRATNAPIDVVHAGGTTSFTVDQTQNSNTWVRLGTSTQTFLFNWTTNEGVTIRNDGANGYVIADGVRFILK